MRHIISTVAMVAAVVLVAPVMAAEQTGVAEQTQSSQQFLSKRPYVQPLAKSDSEKPWEGATLVTQDPEQAEKALMRHNQYQMHTIGKRPYLAPHTTD